eukprot:TRINITY_DN2519_c0_g1_i5.p1 TRINITY_DN2519_c0_g1~~TRINITY_DN2519_c0_g1_i5.p1  ORF type:complete len:481 (+),score=101.99 TRINITY_DN2519_c0_g1_i5:152-1594(+)
MSKRNRQEDGCSSDIEGATGHGRPSQQQRVLSAAPVCVNESCWLDLAPEILWEILADLAARNLFVKKEGARYTVKVADFGVKRRVSSTTSKRRSLGEELIAVRWAAPETCSSGKFTIKSDVWSFGVVLWELMTFGEHPYADMTNRQVVDAVVLKSYRLPLPDDCPSIVADLVNECWSTIPAARPTFVEIYRRLESMHKQFDALDPEESSSDLSDDKESFRKGAAEAFNDFSDYSDYDGVRSRREGDYGRPWTGSMASYSSESLSEHTLSPYWSGSTSAPQSPLSIRRSDRSNRPPPRLPGGLYGLERAGPPAFDSREASGVYELTSATADPRPPIVRSPRAAVPASSLDSVSRASTPHTLDTYARPGSSTSSSFLADVASAGEAAPSPPLHRHRTPPARSDSLRSPSELGSPSPPPHRRRRGRSRRSADHLYHVTPNLSADSNPSLSTRLPPTARKFRESDYSTASELREMALQPAASEP